VTISNLAVDGSGVATADVVAACDASTPTVDFTLRATDSHGLFGEATLTVTVDANTAPALVYPIQKAGPLNGSINISSGSTLVAFLVTLTPATPVTVKVDFATAYGTALAGSDFQATSGTLTFNPGETFKLITVSVNGDTNNEPNETFFVNLSNPEIAVLGDAQGQGTILNTRNTSWMCRS
jgi:hypothetical protein